MNLKRAIRLGTDADGTHVAFVSLAAHNGETKLDASELDKLMAAGLSLNFSLNSNGHGAAYVRAQTFGGNTVTVARFIVEAKHGQAVEYVDGDRLNLRRCNLKLRSGYSKMTCRPGAIRPRATKAKEGDGTPKRRRTARCM